MRSGAGGVVRVIHRHRIGKTVFARVSELSYDGRQPIAVLSWLHDGDARTPGVCVALDGSKLRRGALRRLYFYDGVTEDPRFEDPRVSC